MENREFLRAFEEFAHYHRLADEEKLRLIPLLQRDTASFWYRDLTAGITWTEYKRQMKQHYQVSDAEG